MMSLSGLRFMRWLSHKLGSRVRLEKDADNYQLRYLPEYAPDSDIVFSGAKQKIFCLEVE